MKRRLSAALLSAVMLFLLWPTKAMAAEVDKTIDGSELEYFELPVVDPRFPKDNPDILLPPVEKDAGLGTDEVIDESELEYFELPVVDPRFPPSSTLDNSENDPDAVQFADVHAVKCIDRLNLPQFAKDFYATMERETKPGGFLIDPSRATHTVRYQTDTGTVEAYVLPISYPSENELRRLGFEFDDFRDFISNCVLATFHAFLWDHPEAFWLSGFWSSNNVNTCVFNLILASVNGNVPEWDIRTEEYRGNTARLQSMIDSFDRSVTDIVNAVNGKSNYEKITYFNEWLTTHNQYNYYVAYTDMSVSNSVYACISSLTTVSGQPGNGRTGADGPVCESYSEAFKVLCQRTGIPCVLVCGAGHAWNYVQPDPADGRWYAMDVTWNDPIMNGRPSLTEYLQWGGSEKTAYTLVGADTVVYDGNTETFLDRHPVINKVAGANFVHANFASGPVLNEYAYVDSVTISDLDAPSAGAAPDTSITLTSEPKDSHHPSQAGTGEIFGNPVVTWSPVPSNGTFAADTNYTAIIRYTPRRQGYGLMPADASRIKAGSAGTVTVGADGAIRVTFGGQSVHAKPEEFTRNLPGNLTYDGSSKTAAVRAAVTSSIHNGYFTLTFVDRQNNPVTDLVKPGTYRVLAKVTAHGDYAAGEVSLGSVTITESPGLHGRISLSFGDKQSSSGVAYVPGDMVVAIHAAPDPGYQLSVIRVVRNDNGQQVPLSGSGNTRTFRMPPADVSIQAEFSVR